MKKENKVWKIIGNLDVFVASVVLAGLIVLTVFGVIMRYIVKHPFTWLEEVQLFCMVWIVFSGAGVAFRTGSHVAIEMVVDLFPAKIQKVIEVLIDIIVVFVMIYLFKNSLGYIGMMYKSGRSTSILNIPYWFEYGIAPVSFVITLISYFYSKYFMKDNNEEETA